MNKFSKISIRAIRLELAINRALIAFEKHVGKPKVIFGISSFVALLPLAYFEVDLRVTLLLTIFATLVWCWLDHWDDNN